MNLEPQYTLDGVEYAIHNNAGYYQHYNGEWRESAKSAHYIREHGQPIWPGERRIDVIGTNGNDGLHYK